MSMVASSDDFGDVPATQSFKARLMRVVVTGVQGWLGRFLCQQLLADGKTTVLGIGRSERTDRFTHKLPGFGFAPLSRELSHSFTSRRYKYLACDLLDIDNIRSTVLDFEPTHVFHLAGAIPGKVMSELRKLNVEATGNLVLVLVEAKRPFRLIFSSSGSVYGEPAYLPQDEGHPLGAVSPYAKSNEEAENAITRHCADTEIELTIARIFNLVGPGCPVSLLPGSLAFQLAASAKGLQPCDIKMGSLDSVRDYVDVRDCAAALKHLGELESGLLPVYNIASGAGTKVEEIWTGLQAIALKLGGKAVNIQKLPALPDNVSAHIGDNSRLSACGYTCSTPLQDSLQDLYHWVFSALPDDTGNHETLSLLGDKKKARLNGSQTA